MKERVYVGDCEIYIERKAIKNIYLRVQRKTGQIVLSVPFSLHESEYMRFLESKYEWMRRAQKQIAERYTSEHLGDDELASAGKSNTPIYLWGRGYSVRVLQREKKGSTVICDDEKGELSIIVGPNVAPIDALRQYYRHLLLVEIENLRDECENIVGKKASVWRIRKMKTRWGTCALPSGKITIGEDLVKRPKYCLKYIMIHELVHLHERNHNARFYRLMGRFMPEWENIRQSLRHGIGEKNDGKKI